MTINFFTGRAVINAFLNAMERKSNNVSPYYFTASAVVKPEYLQEVPVKYTPDKKNLEYCVDEEKDGNINVVSVYNAPEITAFCGKLFLINPEHIKNTVVRCFNERVRKGYNPNYHKAVMNVCFTLLEMPMWWYFITTAVNFKELNRKRTRFDSEDVVIFTYQCCENYRTLDLIQDLFEHTLITESGESNIFHIYVDNLAFNDMNDVYYENGVETKRMIIDREGVKLYSTVKYWYDTCESIDYILKRGRVDNE